MKIEDLGLLSRVSEKIFWEGRKSKMTIYILSRSKFDSKTIAWMIRFFGQLYKKLCKIWNPKNRVLKGEKIFTYENWRFGSIE